MLTRRDRAKIASKLWNAAVTFLDTDEGYAGQWDFLRLRVDPVTWRCMVEMCHEDMTTLSLRADRPWRNIAVLVERGALPALGERGVAYRGESILDEPVVCCVEVKQARRHGRRKYFDYIPEGDEHVQDSQT